ncbi:MAG: type II toxin-antitoxin system Phd/YefM family antitoxin [Candidatus Omnitrophota bacterium]
MTTLTVTEAKAHLLEIIRKADKTTERFIVSKNGKPKVIIMGVDEYEGWLETLEIMSEKGALKDIQEAQKELAEGKGYTMNEVFPKNKKKKQ